MQKIVFTRDVIVVALGGIILGFIIGGVIGSKIGASRGYAARETEVQGLQAKIDDLTARIRTIYPEAREVNSISGTIMEVREGELLIEAPVITDLPVLPGEALATGKWTVIIGKGTVIGEIIYSTPSVGGGSDVPVDKRLSLADLRAGDHIAVFTAENIRAKDSFTAESIERTQ